MRVTGISRTAVINFTCGLREIARLNHRDTIQHGGADTPVVKFLRIPFNQLASEVKGRFLKFKDNPDPMRSTLISFRRTFLLDSLIKPAKEYKCFTPQELLEREMKRNTSYQARILTVVGTTKPDLGQDNSFAYELGKELAKNNVIVVCANTEGIMEPFLIGFGSEGGFSIGILPISEVLSNGNKIFDKRGLVSLPIVTTAQHGVLNYSIAVMTGRAALALNGKNASAQRALMYAAYLGQPSILVNTPLPTVGEHPLQNTIGWGDIPEIVNMVGDHIPLERSGTPLSSDASPISTGSRTPVSVLAGTKFDENSVSEEFAESVGKLLAANGYFTITGAGPGAMRSVAKGSRGSLNVGINFFPTYLSSNPFIHIPIVSNQKMERSDYMNLSAVATVNLGGSHSTFDELISARTFGRPIVNCLPKIFNSAYLDTIHSSGNSHHIFPADTAEKVIGCLNLITGR